MRNNQLDRDLLCRYFSGGATPLEKSRIEEWLSGQENQEYFFEVLEDWERSNAQFVPDQEAALQRLNLQLKKEDSGDHPSSGERQSQNKRSPWWMWMVAASVMMLVALSFIFKENILYKNYRTDYGMTKIIPLPDGSEVTLNANSTLRTSRWMKWAQVREVWITGEAYFSVQETEDRRKFKVYTPQLNVEVLGTKFNIRDRYESAKVILQEGRVRVASSIQGKDSALLEEEGDFVEMNRGSDKLVTRQVDLTLYTTWKDNKLKFEEAALPEVLESIREYYGVEIICPDSALLDKKFTGTLPNDDLAIILRSLSNIYAVEFMPGQGTEIADSYGNTKTR